jgi:hypothetical protein
MGISVKKGYPQAIQFAVEILKTPSFFQDSGAPYLWTNKMGIPHQLVATYVNKALQ